MASRIQEITVEIGGDTTKLQNALKGVNGQIRSTCTRNYTIGNRYKGVMHRDTIWGVHTKEGKRIMQ